MIYSAHVFGIVAILYSLHRILISLGEHLFATFFFLRDKRIHKIYNDDGYAEIHMLHREVSFPTSVTLSGVGLSTAKTGSLFIAVFTDSGACVPYAFCLFTPYPNAIASTNA